MRKNTFNLYVLHASAVNIGLNSNTLIVLLDNDRGSKNNTSEWAACEALMNCSSLEVIMSKIHQSKYWSVSLCPVGPTLLRHSVITRSRSKLLIATCWISICSDIGQPVEHNSFFSWLKFCANGSGNFAEIDKYFPTRVTEIIVEIYDNRIIAVSLLGALERKERETVGDEVGPNEEVPSPNIDGSWVSPWASYNFCWVHSGLYAFNITVN